MILLFDITATLRRKRAEHFGRVLEVRAAKLNCS